MAAVNFFRVVVLVHFVLFIWSLTQPLWESGSYSTLGFFLCATGFWSLGHQAEEPVLLFGSLMLFSILNDIIVFGLFVNDETVFQVPGKIGHNSKFSFAMALINLLVKPVYLFVTLREYESRGGDVSVGALRGRGGSGAVATGVSSGCGGGGGEYAKFEGASGAGYGYQTGATYQSAPEGAAAGAEAGVGAPAAKKDVY